MIDIWFILGKIYKKHKRRNGMESININSKYKSVLYTYDEVEKQLRLTYIFTEI